MKVLRLSKALALVETLSKGAFPHLLYGLAASGRSAVSTEPGEFLEMHTPGAGRAAQPVKELAAKPISLSLIMELTQWKGRTDWCRLSPDLHTCTGRA